MARKPSRKGLVKKADTAFSLYIRARDKRCVICGATERLQCGHIFSRVAYSTRWDELNAFAQCAPCNIRHEHDPYLFIEFARKKLGQKTLDSVHQKWHSSVKLKDWQLEEIAQEYIDKYNKLML